MGVNIQTIKDIRLYLAEELEEIYQEPEINALANIIIRNVLGITKLRQLYMSELLVTGKQTLRIINICKELKTGKPLQYILGETIFYDCIIKLNSATLIPRPETEELVDLVIRENRSYSGNIIDFGTGSGCIAIALAANLQTAIVTGIDISDEAILIAKENALINHLEVSFIKADIFNFDIAIAKNAGIFVSNPPYIRDSEKYGMSKNVLDFEPHSALFVADSDPLEYYKAILKVAEETLSKGGRIYFEINEAMGRSMFRLMESFGYSQIVIVADINGKDRIIKGTKNG